MNQKIIVIELKTGFVLYFIEYTNSDYTDGDVIEGNLFKVVESFPEDKDLFTNRHFYTASGEFKPLPLKPSKYHIWNLELEQ